MDSKNLDEAGNVNGSGTPFIPKQCDFPKPGAATKGTPQRDYGYMAKGNKAATDGSGPTKSGRGRAWPKSSK